MARQPRGGTRHVWTLLALAAAGPTTAPITAPIMAPTTAPTTAPAGGLLAQVDAAYAGLSSARFDGTITAHFDVAGQAQDHTAAFTSCFAAPNQFRHEVTGDTLACSTGTHVYATLTGPGEYATGDAPKARAAAADWPAGVGSLLAGQNPSLLLALVPSAKGQLTPGSAAATELPPVEIDRVACPAVKVDAGDDTVATLAFDPATHLLRRATFDLAAGMTKRGTADVRAAVVTIDYTTAKANVPVEAAAFAYAPSPAMVVASAGPVAEGDDAAGDPDEPSKKLVGHPAPAFTLDDLDGHPVTLADQKGKVVVVDIWATWCGPCVASLPHLDALAKDYRTGGAAVAVFAADMGEEADTVKPFVKQKGWTLPVLLDTDGKVGKAYGANAIPETVVIGKDGNVRKVLVGWSGSEDRLKAAIEAELKR